MAGGTCSAVEKKNVRIVKPLFLFLCRLLIENILRSLWSDYDSRYHDPKHHVYVSNLRYELRFIQIPGHSLIILTHQPPHHRITAEREDLYPYQSYLTTPQSGLKAPVVSSVRVLENGNFRAFQPVSGLYGSFLLLDILFASRVLLRSTPPPLKQPLFIIYNVPRVEWRLGLAADSEGQLQPPRVWPFL